MLLLLLLPLLRSSAVAGVVTEDVVDDDHDGVFAPEANRVSLEAHDPHHHGCLFSSANISALSAAAEEGHNTLETRRKPLVSIEYWFFLVPFGDDARPRQV